ncbi:MAG TPA: ABC transporter transmembrane domain-containing protein [Polyangiaceae bacterium]|jgi:ATP-binding cassette subfamily B protein|nr:ABC transporter transmembrane domain-containing protein [Polyangiaceae bacterium]
MTPAPTTDDDEEGEAGVPFGRLLSLARPEWKSLALACVFLAIGSVGTLAYPQALRLILDEALGHKDPTVIDRAALLMIGVLVVQAGASSMRYRLFTVTGERIVARLRVDVYQAILKQELAFFDGRSTGELTSRLASDTTILQNTVSVNVSMALRSIATMIGGVGALVWTSPRLAAVMLAIVPPVAIGAVAYGRRVRAVSREVQDALATSTQVAEESISGLRTVRSFAAEELEARRYAGAVSRSFDIAKRRATMGAGFDFVVSIAGFAVATAVVWCGGHLVMSGSMSVGALTSFFFYTLVVAFSLAAVSDVWADFMKASGAGARIFEILDRVPHMQSGGERPTTIEGGLELVDVSFRYPARPDAPVLTRVSLELRPGEVVALVGPSGSGKSTIAALLARMYDPTSGRVLLDGRDVTGLDVDWLRARIGAVSQEPLLFARSIADNIRYARPLATDAEVEAAARAANAYEFVTSFPDGFATLVGERGVQLSGGQKQRIAIARAVLKDPRVLVLDEATSALDAESEHLVKEALERLMRGRTTLIIAHRLSTVMGADRVLVLDRGRVVQEGSHQSLVGEEGLYRKLVEKQFSRA